MKKFFIPLSMALVILLAACSLPLNTQPTPASPDAAYTQAAQTVAAQLTSIAADFTPTSQVPTNTPEPTATFTPQPTNTQAVPPTNTPKPCLNVGFNNATIDQTVPDNTNMAPNQIFTKTWRLSNIGTCTWTSSYQLIFVGGDGMGVPSNYAQTMTAGTVQPGQSVDVSVNLTAPSAPGTYTGKWQFRDPNGITFGIGGNGYWVVKIKVVNAVTISLTPVNPGVESGTVRADAGPFPDFTVGESNTDITKMVEAFLSYDISSIPAHSTITEVKINFTSYTTEGTPFSLGVMNGYVINIGPTLDTTDFVSGMPNGNTLDWGSLNALNNIEVSAELKTALQAKVGTNRLQLRLQFGGSNNDIVKDRITFTNPTIVITYIAP